MVNGSAWAADSECDALEQKLQREQAIILEREKELSEKVGEEREKFEQDELDRLIIRHHASIEAFNLKLAAFKKTCTKRIAKKSKSAKTKRVLTTQKPVTTEKTVEAGKPGGINAAEDIATSNELIKTLKGYYIQTGAFKNIAIAERFQKRLVKRGYTPTMIVRPYVYAVWVGPYETYKEATAAKETLLTQYRIDGYIIRFKE